MNNFLVNNQMWVLLIGLVIIPVIMATLVIVLNRKKQPLLGRILASVAGIYLYDMMLLGLSLLYLLFGTGSEWIVFIAFSIIPLTIGGIVVLVYHKKHNWAGVSARVITYNIVYFMMAFYFLTIGLGVGYGVGMMILIFIIPVALGVLVYFLLGKQQLIVTTVDDEYVFLVEEHNEKEVCDYINHLQ